MPRIGVFAGENPFALCRSWMAEAEQSEVNDPNAIALATVDAGGMPNARMVLLKEIEDSAFVFYTNYESQKAQELMASGKAAFVCHWKSLRRQIRVRGAIEQEDGSQADAYYNSRSVKSRLGAWASEQSRPIANRAVLEKRLAEVTAEFGDTPTRPPFWGGFRLIPSEIEFWADGAHRLHDRFRWSRTGDGDGSQLNLWDVVRLSP